MLYRSGVRVLPVYSRDAQRGVHRRASARPESEANEVKRFVRLFFYINFFESALLYYVK